MKQLPVHALKTKMPSYSKNMNLNNEARDDDEAGDDDVPEHNNNENE